MRMQPRPITFLRRRRSALGRLLPGVEEMTLSLSVGEAVIFRGRPLFSWAAYAPILADRNTLASAAGAEMPHFGGDLGEGNYHNVLLWTWSLVRD